jgi:magnesium transporter
LEIKKGRQPVTRSINQQGLTWIDITYPNTAIAELLTNDYHFHPLALEDSLRRGQLSKVDDYGSYLLLILHFPNTLDTDMIIKSSWLAAFIGKDYIITIHDDFKALSDLFNASQTEESKHELFTGGSGYLLYRILAYLIDYCFPILNVLLKRMEDIEDQVFDESGNDTKSISILRRDIIAFRRIIWPARSVLNELKVRIKPFTTLDLEIYFDNLMDHLNRIWENLEESKEVIEVFKDSDFVLVTNRINRIVQTLTILSSILLPFIVVSSLYGMNIGLPGGLEHRSYASFGILLGVMFLISGSMLYFFHRRRWI